MFFSSIIVNNKKLSLTEQYGIAKKFYNHKLIH